MPKNQIPISDVLLVRDDLRKKLQYLESWANQYELRYTFMKNGVKDKELKLFIQKSYDYMRSILNDVQFMRQAYMSVLGNVKSEEEGKTNGGQ